MIIRRTGDKPEITRKNVSVSIDPSWNLQKYLLRKQNSSLSSPRFVISLFLLTISRPPRGVCQNTKSPSRFIEKPALKNRPEQALIPNRGRRFEIAGSSR